MVHSGRRSILRGAGVGGGSIDVGPRVGVGLPRIPSRAPRSLPLHSKYTLALNVKIRIFEYRLGMDLKL